MQSAKKRKVVIDDGNTKDFDYSQINTDVLFCTDDIHDYIRARINSHLGGYYGGNGQFVLAQQFNNCIVAYAPPVSTFNSLDPIDYYLNKNHQNIPNGRDVFDELMPILAPYENKSTRILFNFNENNIHWKLCEIQINKTNGNQYHVTIMMHNPYGYGEIEEYLYQEIKKSIRKRIKDHQPNAFVKCYKKKSPYTPRQHRADGTSCGVICANDTLKLIIGESLNCQITYPIGTEELRRVILNQIMNTPDHILAPRTKQRYLEHHFQRSTDKPVSNTQTMHHEDATSALSSSESSEEGSYDFDDEYFNKKTPFTIYRKEAGTISSEEGSESSDESDGFEPMCLGEQENPAYVLNIPAVANGKNNDLQQRIKDVLLKEAFYEDEVVSNTETEKRLRITVGFNRMKSVRKSKNKLLEETLETTKKDPHIQKTFGFYWKPKWKDNITGKRVPWKKVRAWYKALKRKNKAHAKKVIQELESTVTEDIVPYQSIREKIKNHRYTRRHVRKLRERSDVNHVYLSIFDDDFEQLRREEIGLFSEYDRLIAEHTHKTGKPPHVLSTGYMISSIKMPIIDVAVMLDMAVRQATSHYFKNAIYYCEPNSIILVQPNEETVQASFISDGPSAKNELPTLINDLLKKRGINPNETFVFNSQHAPITTRMPNRMLYAKKTSKNPKVFEGDKTKAGKVLRFSFQDLKRLIHTSQSHVKARDWANRIVNCIEIPDEKKLKNGTLLHRQNIQHLLSSILARIFTYYNPIYTAQARLEAGETVPNRINNYIYHLEYVCKHYNNTLCILPYTDKDRSKIKDEKIRNLREKIDKSASFKSLSNILRYTLGNETANQIMRAARDSGEAIRKVIQSHLSFDFPRMVHSMLTDLFENYDPENLSEVDYDNLSDKMRNVLEALADNSFVTMFSNKQLDLDNIEFESGTSLLHLATLSGNKAALRFLLEKGMDISETNTDGLITPLICAIMYCANHGNDLELITMCIDAETVSTPLDNRHTPLIVALTTLDDPWPVVNLLCHAGAVEENLREPLKQLIEFANPRELQNPLLAAIHHLPANTDLALMLINNGCNIDQAGIIDGNTTNPVCECISRSNFRLLYELLQRGATATDINDAHKRPPVLIAYQDTYQPVAFLKLLLNYGAKIDDCCDEENYIIHECISPLSGPYNPPPKNEDEYIKQLYLDIAQLGYGPYLDTDMLDYLCKHHRAFLNTEDGAGKKPIDIAIEGRMSNIVEDLIDVGVDIEHLDRKAFEFIRKHTYYTELYHKDEIEEKKDQENVERAEYAIADSGINLREATKNNDYAQILAAMYLYGVEDEVNMLERLVNQQSEESESSEDAEEVEESSQASDIIYHDINDLDPNEFKYEDEEDLDGEEIDYPQPPLSPRRRDDDSSEDSSSSFQSFP